MSGQGYEIHTPMYMAYFCLMRSFLYFIPNMVGMSLMIPTTLHTADMPKLFGRILFP